MARCKTLAHARSAFSSKYTRTITNTNNANVPSSTTLTHEGIINENYYKLKKKETKLLSNFEISYASITNPITQNREYFLGLLSKSKYDGVGLREPIDIGIALDISGSMSFTMNNNDNDKDESRLDIAKKSLITFINNLSEKDNISITAFDHESKDIVSFSNAKKFLVNKKNIDKINKLKPCGGTDIYLGLKKVYENIKNNKNQNQNFHKRIILITDMEYFEDENFNSLCKEMAENNIFLTILGISESFNTELTEKVSKIKGCNYYVILNESDMKKYLIDEFNYVCFPLSFNEKLEILSPFLKIKSIIGTGNKEFQEKKEDIEWSTRTHKLFDKQFKQNIFFMLLYFKRKGKILPKPVILCISQFIKQMHKKTISEINTTFPSALTEYKKEFYVKGGMILIKLDENSLKEDNICQFSLSCEDQNNVKYNKDIVFNFEKKKEDFFSDENIEVSLGLYYFTKFNRKIMKICNEEYKNKKNNSLTFIKNDKFNGIKSDIINLLMTRYNKYNVNDNLNKYLTNMDDICKNAEAYAKIDNKNSEKNEIELDEEKEADKNEQKRKVKKGNKRKKIGAKKNFLGKKRKKGR